MTRRTEQYVIIYSMAIGAALLSGATALTSLATLAQLQGSEHPYKEAWLVALTPFVVFPVLGQFLLNLASGFKSPPQPEGWDGKERRGNGRSPAEVEAAASTAAAETASHAAHAEEIASLTGEPPKDGGDK